MELNNNDNQNASAQNETVEVIEEPMPIVENTTRAIEEEKVISPSDNIKGLNAEELKDPNKIKVTIIDENAPIVILFGPPSCGKTMTLVRLTRFLRDKQYTITPIKSFRPSYDQNYIDICEDFDEMINQDDAAKSTDRISFMLVKVIKSGRTICQILEAPGEYYFNPQFPKSPFPRYFNAIKSSKNRKIWAIMVEPDWQNAEDRLNYVDRIKRLRTQMSTKDKTIIIYNKIDKTEYLIDNSGNAHLAWAKKNARDLYPGIFEPFKNTIPISRWFTPYRMDFTIFQTGDYSDAADGTKLFEKGPDVYPSRLWKIIMKHVRG